VGKTETYKCPAVITEIRDGEFIAEGMFFDFAEPVSVGDLYQPTNQPTN
jgi:hypothetical protein